MKDEKIMLKMILVRLRQEGTLEDCEARFRADYEED